MNPLYFRKSKHALDATVKQVMENIKGEGWAVFNEMDLPLKRGKLISIYKHKHLEKFNESDPSFAGFLIHNVTAYRKSNDILAGFQKPVLLKAFAKSQEIQNIAEDTETELTNIINKSTGAGELKPKSVKLYSTMTCPYCKMEQSWLESNKVKHEMVFVDLNPKEAQAMVDKTGQMGVPVTEITYEDADSEYVVGFDKPKLAQLLNIGL